MYLFYRDSKIVAFLLRGLSKGVTASMDPFVAFPLSLDCAWSSEQVIYSKSYEKVPCDCLAKLL